MASLYRNPDFEARRRAAEHHRTLMRERRERLMAQSHAAEGFELVRISESIAATDLHIRAWGRYIAEGCPLEPRAQITASSYAHLI